MARATRRCTLQRSAALSSASRCAQRREPCASRRRNAVLRGQLLLMPVALLVQSVVGVGVTLHGGEQQRAEPSDSGEGDGGRRSVVFEMVEMLFRREGEKGECFDVCGVVLGWCAAGNGGERERYGACREVLEAREKEERERADEVARRLMEEMEGEEEKPKKKKGKKGKRKG
eukprot:2480389-Rhodomonas_salina.1